MMADTRTVSVVMATYNGALFIREQLDSLAAQSKLPTELIISDDGSDDDTIVIAERFSDNAPFPVKIVQNVFRLGYAENFLHACRLARSQYVAFCDQDDIWHPQKLACCLDLLQRSGALLCAHAVTLVDHNGDYLGVEKQGMATGDTLDFVPESPWTNFLGMTQIFERSILDLLPQDGRGLDPNNGVRRLAHDQWTDFLARSFGKVATTSQFLAKYRQHNSNASGLRPKSGLHKLSVLAGVAASPQLKRVEIADGRVKLLTSTFVNRDKHWSYDRIRISLGIWTNVKLLESQRLEMYADRVVVGRVTKLLKLIALGGYRPYAKKGLGRALFLKDVVVGVLRLRRVKV